MINKWVLASISLIAGSVTVQGLAQSLNKRNGTQSQLRCYGTATYPIEEKLNESGFISFTQVRKLKDKGIYQLIPLSSKEGCNSLLLTYIEVKGIRLNRVS